MLSRSSALLLVSVALLAVAVSARPLHLARHAAAPTDAHSPNAYSYELVTYELADTSCTQGPTGGTSVTANECTLPPNSIANWFHGFKIKNVDRNSGNYSLALYFESPLCDGQAPNRDAPCAFRLGKPSAFRGTRRLTPDLPSRQHPL